MDPRAHAGCSSAGKHWPPGKPQHAAAAFTSVGRSPDIVVRQQPLAAPLTTNGALADLGDSHDVDVARPGANFAYVRVRNRTRLQLDQVRVRLFRLPPEATQSSACWVGSFEGDPSPGSGVPIGPIAAGARAVAEIPIDIPADPDTAMPATGKGVMLLAMANVSDAAGNVLEPFPDIAAITDVAASWRFFAEGPLAASAALRGLRFRP